MNGTFCIDKRIGYLALFAVPLMVLTIFSLMINSQKVTQNSRAEGPVPTSIILIEPTSVPVTIPMSYVCFTKKNTGGAIISKGAIKEKLVMSVYDSKMNLLTILDSLPISIPVNLREDSYIGIQGQNTGLANVMSQCGQL
ncbi:MAG: hypothetical protein AAB929_03820 [Patescibacteria group bacterium]